jgi:hypothetical protein
MNVSELVTGYLQTWNETDPAARRKAIDELWAQDGIYTDPMAVATGLDQIDATIGAVQDQFPDSPSPWPARSTRTTTSSGSPGASATTW